MKTVKIISLVALIGMMSACKKEKTQEEEKLQEPVALEYSEPNAQEAPQEPTVDPATAPILVLEKDTYDLGQVQAGKTVERKITFKNQGKGPLLIKEAKASCGCTVPEFSKEPVAVGQEGTLLIKFTAPAYNTHTTKTVTLQTNTVQGVEEFKITATVVGGQEQK